MSKERMALSPWEATAMRLIVAAAEAGARAPTADDLQEACGCSSVSTTVNLVANLERRGLIAVERFQRARRMTVLATGKSTAPVANATAHWRAKRRPSEIPSIAPSQVQMRAPELAQEMMGAARGEGLSFQDFLAELVWAGWRVRGEAEAREG